MTDAFTQVRNAINIVDLIGEHVALKRAGREFKGLCLFHPDHRPSMCVIPHKQIFHCFVCQTGGDVFDFIEKHQHMTKAEALRYLAQRAGIALPELPARRGEAPGIRERLAVANEWGCQYFQTLLRDPKGKAGLDYLHGRGITDDSIERFRLGMSPSGWTTLVMHATKSARTMADLVDAGLVKQRQDGSPYDGFRGRVMFPIVDAGGRVIAFGGRVLVERRDDAGNVLEAKYLNSPDSPLFNKSTSLYGLHLARPHIVRTHTVIVVEGYTDVIACHQVGVENAVATLGTALTPEHIQILERYAQAVVLMFDSDEAGRKAAERALGLFVQARIDVKIASVPDGKDPCDFCIRHGGAAFQGLVDRARDAMEYCLQALQVSMKASGVTARQEAAAEFMGLFRELLKKPGVDPIRKGQLLLQAQKALNVSREDFARMLYPPKQNVPLLQSGPVAMLPEGDEVIDVGTLTGRDLAEARLLGVLLCEPAMFNNMREECTLELFGVFGPLAESMLAAFEDLPGGFLELLEALPESQRPLARELSQRVAHLLEPVGVSAGRLEQAKRLNGEVGMDVSVLAQDCLKRLRKVRK
jgi:DNA primase catalytic core